MYVFFKNDLPFDALAQRLREILNIPDRNITPYLAQQKRESVNMGGEYYLFEVFGLELKLLRNVGEVEIAERSGWPHYLFIDMEAPANLTVLHCMTEYVCHVVNRAGLRAEVEHEEMAISD